MQLSPLVITLGEPAGIGPDCIIQLAAIKQQIPWVVVGDRDVIASRAQQLNIPLKINPYTIGQEIQSHHEGEIDLFHIPLQEPVKTSQLNSKHATTVLSWIKFATEHCLERNFSGMVTNPVHKSNMQSADPDFMGHTEYLAKLCGVHDVVMMMANSKLKITLSTTHIPLKEVVRYFTSERLEMTIKIVDSAFKNWFKVKQPRIGVCGLNPHAGENGYLGLEEKNILKPLIEDLRDQGFDLSDPIPADTAFLPYSLEQYDVIVTHYHDQGLPVIKALDFEGTVNVTLGLPIIRTSVDHGTALNLAGTGRASAKNLESAILLAWSLACHEKALC